MSEVIPESHQEFWRPPAIAQTVVAEPLPSSPTVPCCTACQTEFMPGARFCYLCGAVRGVATSGKLHGSRNLSFLRVLGFQHIKQALGLPVSSLVGFFAGLSCLLAALAVGRVLTVQTVAEFQAVQFLRIEWLLGSVAAFLIAILFKCATQNPENRE